jgi:large subunit ribosomal protein L10
VRREVKMKRKEKEVFVAHVREEILASSIVVAVDRTTGITVAEMTKLRSRMRKAGAGFKVLKNTLARKAISDSVFDQIDVYLKGPTGLAYSNNPVDLAKDLQNFAKENDRLKILGGVMDGKAITSAIVKELSSLPTMDELRAKIIGLLTAAASKIIGTVNEPARRLAVLLASKN